jgi:hypothetical protein
MGEIHNLHDAQNKAKSQGYNGKQQAQDNPIEQMVEKVAKHETLTFCSGRAECKKLFPEHSGAPLMVIG